MSNSPQLTPGQAIERIIMMFEGFFKLRASGNAIKMPSIMLEGEPGVGKTSIAAAVAKAFNYRLVEIQANNKNPDDVIGVQMPNVATKTTDWYAPAWMPKPGPVIVDGHEYDGTLIFFDELSSADDRVRKPLFTTFLEYHVAGIPLPENTIVMGAGNTTKTGTQVYEFDNATRVRFTTLTIIADFTSWLSDFALHSDMSPTIIALLKSNQGIFCETEKALENGLDIYGNPRSWERSSNYERAIMLEPEHRKDGARRAALRSMISGQVGEANGELFDAVFETVAQMTTLYDILEAKRAAKPIRGMLPTKLDQLNALSFSMMAYPTNIETATEIFELMRDFPSDTELPLRDTIPAIQEAILKKLRKGGFKDKDFAVFNEDVKRTTDEFHKGPIIKIEL